MTEDLQLNSSVHISQTEFFHFGNVFSEATVGHKGLFLNHSFFSDMKWFFRIIIRSWYYLYADDTCIFFQHEDVTKIIF